VKAKDWAFKAKNWTHKAKHRTIKAEAKNLAQRPSANVSAAVNEKYNIAELPCNDVTR